MNRERLEKESAVQSKERLQQAAALTEAELFSKYALPAAGLDEALVRQNREQYGSNSIARKKRDSVWKRLLKSFVTPFTIVLFVLAGISMFTDILLASPQDRSYTTVVMVSAMVLISGLMTYVQEARSEQSAEKLTAMVRNTISVLREGQRRELPMNELVGGDHVYLASGDMIPADLRLIKTKDLFISQSALTGESDPIEKYAEPDQDSAGIADRMPESGLHGQQCRQRFGGRHRHLSPAGTPCSALWPRS
jgi:Mg2+-importing ATPase